MRECCKQSMVEVLSKITNKIHQTWGPPFSRLLQLNHVSTVKITRDYPADLWTLPYFTAIGENSNGLQALQPAVYLLLATLVLYCVF